MQRIEPEVRPRCVEMARLAGCRQVLVRLIEG